MASILTKRSNQSRIDKNKSYFNKTRFYLFFFLLVFYTEMVVKIYCFGGASFKSILYTGLFSASLSLGCAFFCSLWSKKINQILTIIFVSIIVLLCMAQIVYFTIFGTFGTLYSLYVGADAITGFWSGTVSGIISSIVPLLFVLIPSVVFIKFSSKFVPDKRQNLNTLLKIVLGSIIFYLLALLIIINNSSGIMPDRYLYRNSFIPNLTVDNFGVMTTIRLDAQNLLFKNIISSPQPPIEEEETEEEQPEKPERRPEYGYNVTEINFDELIENENNETIIEMHKYFSSVEPTKKNKYTGLFEGKNLIWIVGEAFSTLALNDEVTPTLSKLAGEGFVFNNFYNPVWSVSTSDGEYVTLTGLIPKSGVWSFRQSSKIYMPYGFGNLLSSLGYSCKAYHNHYYNYYDRHLSHPNLGYDYKGLGNGLKVTEVWPESDLEMMQVTIPNDITQTPFHTYYMTVSGHLNYTTIGNTMAKRNWDAVKDLEYSDPCKAYLACNVELDKAISYILEQLELAGELENTVIVLSGDHYPYGLTDEELDELAGYEQEKKFEKFRSTLIIWSASMEEAVVVDKVCSSLDVMPTIANLMGLEYDSRLVMGRDILSDSSGLVIFNDRSWITDLGRYDAKQNLFTPIEGVTISETYAKNILKKVNNAFYYSAKILEKDYYSKVLK
jgi:lipoteichoic acid synthase